MAHVFRVGMKISAKNVAPKKLQCTVTMSFVSGFCNSDRSGIPIDNACNKKSVRRVAPNPWQSAGNSIRQGKNQPRSCCPTGACWWIDEGLFSSIRNIFENLLCTDQLYGICWGYIWCATLTWWHLAVCNQCVPDVWCVYAVANDITKTAADVLWSGIYMFSRIMMWYKEPTVQNLSEFELDSEWIEWLLIRIGDISLESFLLS